MAEEYTKEIFMDKVLENNGMEINDEIRQVTLFGEQFNIYGDIEKPMFLAIDIAEMIEYSPDKTHQMLELVDDDEKLIDTIYRAGQNRDMWFVSEFGLYELLMQSRKPLAKRFKLAVKNLLKQIRLGEYNQTRTFRKTGDCYTFYNAKIIFRNFSGEGSTFNRPGDRNFSIVVDNQAMADKLVSDGWNVKMLKARDESEEPKWFIPVAVRYDNFPPKIWKISGQTKTLLDEESVGSLDFDELEKVDVTITPSKWEMSGKSGIKAYVKTMFATLVLDELTESYLEDLPFK